MEIIKGKPIPARSGRSKKYGWVYDMEYGDCVMVTDDVEKQKISAAIRNSDSKCKVVTRTEKTDGVCEITIWKIKK
jgi:hypothetical protein|tara:strand:- start:128 stop:355 length:228 start_codon:yes stop_codon:yes gene_type:complete